MKKTLIILAFFIAGTSVFAQGAPRLPTVGIMPFEVQGTSVNAGEAAEATRLVIGELTSWGIMVVLSGDEAQGAEYLVRGQITRQSSRIILTAATYRGNSSAVLNNSREEAADLNSISFESFCAKIAENIPFPNYLLGRWRSSIDMPDGPVTCILEFRSDRTVRAEQYDTWEHNGTNSLKYQGIGAGNYTYAGYLRRTVTIGGRTIQADATVGINLSLEDTLPKYGIVNVGGLRVLFDEAKTSFELVSGSLPCGDNFTGPSIYPSANVYYTKFIKIQ